MSSSIQVTPEQMRATANAVNGSIDQWRNATTRIEALVSEMGAMWDGLGNDAFDRVFAADQPKFQNLLMLMTEYMQAIQTAAATYDAGEAEVQSIVTRRN